MKDTGSYEALSAGDEPSGEVRSPEGKSRANHESTREEQWPEEDMRVTTRGRSVAGVLAFGGWIVCQ